MGRAEGAVILHADLDAFYASVEQLLDPSLRGRPIAVGGGVVLAASYEAKVLGVTAGMAGWRARQLCPDLRFVSGHFRQYQRLGDVVMGILGDFTPHVERVSIDEAFLDVSGAVHLFGPPADIAAGIRRRVREEVGLAVSVGAARTKHLAKVASQVAKPDGLVVVDPGRELEFLGPLPVGLIWGVGPRTRERLAGVGIHTIGQLAATSTPILQGLVGEAAGSKLGALSNDLDPRRVSAGRPAVSMGAQAALGRRPARDDVVRPTLAYLADRVAGRLRAAGRAGRRVTVRVRFPGMRSVTRSATLCLPVCTTLTLTEVAADLVGSALADNPREREITLLAVSVSQLVAEPALQLELAVDPARGGLPPTLVASSRRAVDGAVDSVRERFGRTAVGYAPVVLSAEHRVPDEFRELAERRPRPATTMVRGKAPSTLVLALRRAGCVAAEEEAEELWSAAGGDVDRLEDLVSRRTVGEPLAWVTGSTEFCGIRLRVDPGVYVPRWQSEPLALRAAELTPAAGRALDLCTGCGAVAAVLHSRVPDALVIATDISPASVACARANGVDARPGSLDDPVPADWEGGVDVVISVAPYVPTESLHLLDRDSREHEPAAALDGGPGGTHWLEEIVVRAPRWLRPGTGRLLLELGEGQLDRLSGALEGAGLRVVGELRDEDEDLRGAEVGWAR